MFWIIGPIERCLFSDVNWFSLSLFSPKDLSSNLRYDIVNGCIGDNGSNSWCIDLMVRGSELDGLIVK